MSDGKDKRTKVEINGVDIRDNFAEAFPMKATRIIVTATNERWVHHAAAAMTGFATSVIACEVEGGVERWLSAEQTPDGRPGVAMLFCTMDAKGLAKQVEKRVGQCILTCPGTAAFSGIPENKSLDMGNRLRYFGDGHQISKVIGGKRYWRIPVMDGEFVCEDTTGICDAVGGGNFLMLGRDHETVLTAAEAAVDAMNKVNDIILPFPGGVVRSGSKVGSRYPALIASTNHRYCPSLRGLTESSLDEGTNAVLEIVIDGLSEDAVAEATRVGVEAACATSRDNALHAIDAGNYGGKLGKYHFHLWTLLEKRSPDTPQPEGSVAT